MVISFLFKSELPLFSRCLNPPQRACLAGFPDRLNKKFKTMLATSIPRREIRLAAAKDTALRGESTPGGSGKGYNRIGGQ
jgi:hypothetical protein